MQSPFFYKKLPAYHIRHISTGRKQTTAKPKIFPTAGKNKLFIDKFGKRHYFLWEIKLLTLNITCMNVFKKSYLQFMAAHGVLSLTDFSFLCHYCSSKLPKEFGTQEKMPCCVRMLKEYMRKNSLREEEVIVLKHCRELWPLYAYALRSKTQASSVEQAFLINDFPDDLFEHANVSLDKEFVDKMINEGAYKKLRHYVKNHGLPNSTESLFVKKAAAGLKNGERECFEALASYIKNYSDAFSNYDSWVNLLTSGSPEITELADKTDSYAHGK